VDGYATTANLLVRRDVFLRVGPFDGTLLSGGDREWSMRRAAIGASLHYAPDVVVRHPARKTLAQLISKRRRTAGGERILEARHGRLKPLPRATAVGANDVSRIGKVSKKRLLLAPQDLGMSRRQGLAVLLINRLMHATARIERLRLALGGRPLR
jgi:hypothetical protein